MGFLADVTKMIIWIAIVYFVCFMFVDAIDETLSIEQKKSQQWIERLEK